MANGIVSQKGDSGGPVYTITPDDRAVLVGVFNSTWVVSRSQFLGMPPISR